MATRAARPAAASSAAGAGRRRRAATRAVMNVRSAGAARQGAARPPARRLLLLLRARASETRHAITPTPHPPTHPAKKKHVGTAGAAARGLLRARRWRWWSAARVSECRKRLPGRSFRRRTHARTRAAPARRARGGAPRRAENPPTSPPLRPSRARARPPACTAARVHREGALYARERPPHPQKIPEENSTPRRPTSQPTAAADAPLAIDPAIDPAPPLPPPPAGGGGVAARRGRVPRTNHSTGDHQRCLCATRRLLPSGGRPTPARARAPHPPSSLRNAQPPKVVKPDVKVRRGWGWWCCVCVCVCRRRRGVLPRSGAARRGAARPSLLTSRGAVVRGATRGPLLRARCGSEGDGGTRRAHSTGGFCVVVVVVAVPHSAARRSAPPPTQRCCAALPSTPECSPAPPSLPCCPACLIQIAVGQAHQGGGDQGGVVVPAIPAD